jgi:transcriptional pleiotropic repressor
MQEKSLLEKVRKINRLILESDSDSFNISGVLNSLASVIDASVFLTGTEGQLLLGQTFSERWVCGGLQEYVVAKGELPDYLNITSFMLTHEPQVNLICQVDSCMLLADAEGSCAHEAIYLSALPILTADIRVGTLVLLRCGCSFEHDDIILAEICLALLGIVLNRETVEREQESARNKTLASVAFDSLSYSEVEAIEEIFKSLEGTESIIVASKIADSLGITRSVIVNALRKFESAGIIESRSLGMKGTYIRVSNPQALQEITQRSVQFRNGFG